MMKTMGKPWENGENHGKNMGKPWKTHWKMVIKWENYGKTMGKWWLSDV